MNIKLLKLLSGEEILAEIIDSETQDNKIAIKKPMVLRQNPQSGEFVLVPWLQLSSNEEVIGVELEKLIIEPQPIHQEISNSYIQASTGIEVSPASQLITG